MRIFRTISGLIILPFLYLRYSFILFLPLLFIDGIHIGHLAWWWFVYAIFYMFIMSVCGGMKYLTKALEWVFKVKYSIEGQWTSPMIHSYSAWSHPILKVREKEYKLMIATMGGNSYTEEDNLRRKAIVYWLLGPAK